MGPQFQPQDSRGGAAAAATTTTSTPPVGFSAHSHSSSFSHANQPVFVIINPPTPQQHQQTAVAAPPPSPPLADSAQHPIIVKEEHLPSEEELLEIVSLEEKQTEEVGRRCLKNNRVVSHLLYRILSHGFCPPGPSADLWPSRTGPPPDNQSERPHPQRGPRARAAASR